MSSTWISQFHWSELHQWFCRFDGVLFLFDFNILALFPSDCDCKMNVKIFFCCCLDDCSIPASLNALKFDPNSFRQLCLLFNDLGLSEYSGIILLLSTSLKPGSVLFFLFVLLLNIDWGFSFSHLNLLVSNLNFSSWTRINKVNVSVAFQNWISSLFVWNIY